MPGGICVEAYQGEQRCAYPEETCPSYYAWSILAGEELQEDCADFLLPTTTEMALVPGRPFMMGCDSEAVTDCLADQLPYHEVRLSSFEIDRTEVTNAEYQQCVSAGACQTPIVEPSSPFPYCADWMPATNPTAPVNCIDYPRAVSYCTWKGKRLPTEAEWELAARGTDGRPFPWGDSPQPDCTVGYYSGCVTGFQSNHPNGVSPYGVLAMDEGISEWTSDYYDANYYSTSPVQDPTGPATGASRVRRGGNYMGGVGVSYRNSGILGVTWGIRCARSYP